MSIAYPRPKAPFERHRGEPRPVGVCRLCGRLTWKADAVGPVHDCCTRVPAGGTCWACEESLNLHKKAEQWWQSRRRKVAG